MSKPRFSLAALLLAVTAVAVLLAYMRSQQHPAIDGVVGFTTVSGAYSKETVAHAADSLKTLVRKEGYKPCPVPDDQVRRAIGFPSGGEWFSRQQNSGTVYVFVFQAHDMFRVQVLASKMEGPFADSATVDAESKRLKKVIEKWLQDEIETREILLRAEFHR